jgi:hypothetical protein
MFVAVYERDEVTTVDAAEWPATNQPAASSVDLFVRVGTSTRFAHRRASRDDALR